MVKPKYSQSKKSIPAHNLLMDMFLIHIDRTVMYKIHQIEDPQIEKAQTLTETKNKFNHQSKSILDSDHSNTINNLLCLIVISYAICFLYIKLGNLYFSITKISR